METSTMKAVFANVMGKISGLVQLVPSLLVWTEELSIPMEIIVIAQIQNTEESSVRRRQSVMRNEKHCLSRINNRTLNDSDASFFDWLNTDEENWEKERNLKEIDPIHLNEGILTISRFCRLTTQIDPAVRTNRLSVRRRVKRRRRIWLWRNWLAIHG